MRHGKQLTGALSLRGLQAEMTVYPDFEKAYGASVTASLDGLERFPLAALKRRVGRRQGVRGHRFSQGEEHYRI